MGTDQIAVKVEDLTIRFGDFVAVDKISFTVSKGEIFGFLGANGAGKTTTIRTLCGLLVPSSGSVIVAGIDIRQGRQQIKEKVGYMSQRFTLYNDLTVKENLEFASALRKLDKETAQKRIEELFAFVGFDAPEESMVKDLPAGIKQQVSLVASILHDPEIVFLDEPTAGVSPSSRARFWSLIRSLSSAGKTVFVTTHYMDEAEECQRIALMRTGQIIALDTPAHLKVSTFPEPMVELELNPSTARATLESLKKLNCIGKLQPYGMHYHVIVKEENAWSSYLKTRPDLKIRKIPPSLEDVFIRIVEGE